MYAHSDMYFTIILIQTAAVKSGPHIVITWMFFFCVFVRLYGFGFRSPNFKYWPSLKLSWITQLLKSLSLSLSLSLSPHVCVCLWNRFASCILQNIVQGRVYIVVCIRIYFKMVESYFIWWRFLCNQYTTSPHFPFSCNCNLFDFPRPLPFSSTLNICLSSIS